MKCFELEGGEAGPYFPFSAHDRLYAVCGEGVKSATPL